MAWIVPQLMSWEITSIFGRRKPNLGEQRLGQGTLGRVQSRIGVERMDNFNPIAKFHMECRHGSQMNPGPESLLLG